MILKNHLCVAESAVFDKFVHSSSLSLKRTVSDKVACEDDLCVLGAGVFGVVGFCCFGVFVFALATGEMCRFFFLGLRGETVSTSGAAGFVCARAAAIDCDTDCVIIACISANDGPGAGCTGAT